MRFVSRRLLALTFSQMQNENPPIVKYRHEIRTWQSPVSAIHSTFKNVAGSKVSGFATLWPGGMRTPRELQLLISWKEARLMAVGERRARKLLWEIGSPFGGRERGEDVSYSEVCGEGGGEEVCGEGSRSWFGESARNCGGDVEGDCMVGIDRDDGYDGGRTSTTGCDFRSAMS